MEPGSPPPSTRWTKGSEGSSPPPSRWTRGEDGAASPSPLVTNKQRIPASPMLTTNTNTNKVASNTSSKQTNKLVSKQSPGSLISASESRTGSKVKISFQKSRANIFFAQQVLPLGGSETGSGSMVVMRGLLWVQQDRIFCRWKERYIHKHSDLKDYQNTLSCHQR